MFEANIVAPLFKIILWDESQEQFFFFKASGVYYCPTVALKMNKFFWQTVILSNDYESLRNNASSSID